MCTSRAAGRPPCQVGRIMSAGLDIAGFHGWVRVQRIGQQRIGHHELHYDPVTISTTANLHSGHQTHQHAGE